MSDSHANFWVIWKYISTLFIFIPVILICIKWLRNEESGGECHLTKLCIFIYSSANFLLINNPKPVLKTRMMYLTAQNKTKNLGS